MKIKTIMYALGIKETPKYTASFGASHPVNGVFYWVSFADGKTGIVRCLRSGTYDPQVQCIPKDRKKTFVTFKDAAEALYRGLIEYGAPTIG